MAVCAGAKTTSYGNGVFSDDEFESVAQEVVHPQLSDYEEFVKSHGITFYRKYIEETGLYEYKIVGVMEDLDPELCAMVHVDWEYMKKWDSYCQDIYPVHDETEGLDGIYWAMKFPWPMSNRDFTLIREMKIMEVDGKKTWAALTKHHSFPSVPEKNGVIRVTELKQACVVESDGKTGTKVCMYHHDNPKGMIPKWLINWATKSGIHLLMKTLAKAVLGYNDFLEEKRKELGLETLNNEERLKMLFNAK